MGLVSSVAEAARFHWVVFKDNYIKHKGRGLSAQASPERCEEARTDICSVSSSLHVFALRMGGWPICWFDTQAELPPAWLINKRRGFTFRIAVEISSPDLPAASSEEGFTHTQLQTGERLHREGF